MKKTWEGINNVLARKLKNTKPITFIKDPNDNDSVTSDPNLVPRASVTFVQRMGQRTLWKNPKPEPQNPGSGLTAPA